MALKKHLSYDEITLNAANGILTENPMHYITDNRRVAFNFEDGVWNGRELYAMIDGQLSGPLKYGERMQTGVQPWEILVPMPHAGSLFVVDKHPQPLNIEMQLEVPVRHPSGQMLKVDAAVRFTACIQCRDAEAMILEYIDGAFKRPEDDAEYTVRSAVQNAVAEALNDLCGTTNEMADRLSQLRQNLGSQVARAVRGTISWLNLKNPLAEVTVQNLAELLEQENREYEYRFALREKLVDACVKYFTKDTISEPAIALIQQYVSTNPGATQEELENFTKMVAKLGARCDPPEIMRLAQNAGILKKGGSGLLSP